MECQVTQAPRTSMTLDWRDTLEGVDWAELTEL
jgi:hypothetical protein